MGFRDVLLKLPLHITKINIFNLCSSLVVVYNECFQHTPSEEAISVVVICGENTFSVLAAFSAVMMMK